MRSPALSFIVFQIGRKPVRAGCQRKKVWTGEKAAESEKTRMRAKRASELGFFFEGICTNIFKHFNFSNFNISFFFSKIDA